MRLSFSLWKRVFSETSCVIVILVSTPWFLWCLVLLELLSHVHYANFLTGPPLFAMVFVMGITGVIDVLVTAITGVVDVLVMGITGVIEGPHEVDASPHIQHGHS